MLTDSDLAVLDADDKQAFLANLVNCEDVEGGIQEFEGLIPGVSKNAADAGSIFLSWRDALRNIWIPDPDARRWGIGQLISVKVYGVENPQNHWPFINSPDFQLPSRTAIESLLHYLTGKKVHPARCPNPDCSTPYFFKIKGQKTCRSDQCVRMKKREQNKRWWDGPRGVARRKKLREQVEKENGFRAHWKRR